MKRYVVMLFSLLALVGCQQEKNEVIVANRTDIPRVGEMIEVDAARFGVEEGKTLVVRNEKGEVVPSQITYDGKLIFQSDVEAGATAHYTVAEGKPTDFKVYACGRVYPERVDDVAWESDLIAYRAYGPALQRSGERAFGYDVWVKNNTALPVVEARYEKELNPDTKAQIAELRKSDPKAADELYASVSYHNDHGNGFDAYKVGPTLGGGATALIDDNGGIVYPYCWSECEMLDNGPLRFTVRLRYNPTIIDGQEVTEVRTISIDKGAFLNKTTVVYEGEGEKELKVMAGIVLHEKKIRASYDEENCYVTYAEAVEAPNGGELYQAIFFPNGWNGAENRLWRRGDDRPAGTFGHAAAYKTLRAGEAMTYYWGALWNHSTEVEVPTKEAFDSVMAGVVAARKSPLIVATVTYDK